MHGLKSLEDHRTGRNPRDLHKSGEMPTAVSPSSNLEGYITLQGMDNFLNSTDTSHTNKFSILIFFLVIRNSTSMRSSIRSSMSNRFSILIFFL